jgi:hypothetical protein
MNCIYQSKINERGRFNCAIGWYGGRPWLGNCLGCLKRGDNTPEAKAAFDAKAERAHPANRKRIQGCCDRADQA